jgi:hypothetical protein
VGRNVAAFVIGVQSVIKADDFDKALLVTKADSVGKVVRQILGLVDGGARLAITVSVVVNAGSDRVDFGAEIEGVLQDGLPVVGLLEASSVLFGERRVVAALIEQLFEKSCSRLLQCSRSGHKLGHGVQCLG